MSTQTATQPADSSAVTNQLLISADSHVHFTDEWVKARMPARLHPVWDGAKAKQAHYEKTVLRAGADNLPMEDFIDLDAATDPGHFEPNGKLKAMDRDGVQAEVIFPEVGGTKLCTPEWMGDDWKEALSSYNRSMIDFASVNTRRLLTAYQISLFDIPFAVSEVERVSKEGARCVQVPTFPSDFGLPDVWHERYNPLWSAISDAGLTIMNHLEMRPSHWPLFGRDPTPQKGIMTTQPCISMSESIAMWIMTGTLERYPKLNVIMVEPGLGWLPWYVEKLDLRLEMHYTFPNIKKKPNEYFKNQIGVTFMDEPEGLRACYQAFGPNNIYWSTDFPHPATCWPNSQRQVKSQFAKAGIPEHDIKKIVYGNAQRTFGLGV